MPEEEGENQSDAESHEPGDKHERSAFDVGEMAEYGHPFGNLAGRLRKDFALFCPFNQSKRSINSGKVSLIRFISFILCPIDSLTRRSSLLWSCDGVEIRAAAEQVSDGTRSQEPEERKERSTSIRH